MNEKQAPLSVCDLRVTIGGNPILRQVNLTFPRNRITCIIGPSGCGKSTLLKTLNRMHYNVEGLQVSGSVLLGTHDVIRANDQELLELRRNIGLVPQKPCPLPMSIFDNVAYGCRIHGMYRKKELPDVVEKYLTEVGLWDEVKDRLGSPAVRLSLGQQQRLCLARTLAVAITGQADEARAVRQARREFNRISNQFEADRQRNIHSATVENIPEIHRSSLLWAFYGLRKRKYSQL